VPSKDARRERDGAASRGKSNAGPAPSGPAGVYPTVLAVAMSREEPTLRFPTGTVKTNRAVQG